MDKSRVIILILAMAAILALSTCPCAGNQKNDQDIFTEGNRGPGPVPGQGPGPGPGMDRGQRRGPGRGRFELTEQEIDRILKDLKEHSPEKAKMLEELRNSSRNYGGRPARNSVKSQENAGKSGFKKDGQPFSNGLMKICRTKLKN